MLFALVPMPMVIAHDFMCGLLRFAMAYGRQFMSEKMAEFCGDTVIKVVEKFHFFPSRHSRGHKGEWCAQHVSPALHEELLKDVNTVVCEQRFKWISRFKSLVLINMSPRTFEFLLLLICWIDHEERARDISGHDS